MTGLHRPLEERFWSFVHFEPNSGCWLWAGSCDKRGYGQIRAATRGPKSLRYATHVSLEIHGRQLKAGEGACHTCDNPPCVNPDHLFGGTQKQNIHDCIAKGRNSKPPVCKVGARPLKMVCVNGHSLTGENIYLRPDGYRTCRLCRSNTKTRMRVRRITAGLTTRGTERIRNARTA